MNPNYTYRTQCVALAWGNAQPVPDLFRESDNVVLDFFLLLLLHQGKRSKQ